MLDGQVTTFDCYHGANAVEARSFVVLELKDLQQSSFLAGGCHDRQAESLTVQKQPDRGYRQQVDATHNQLVKELDDA